MASSGARGSAAGTGDERQWWPVHLPMPPCWEPSICRGPLPPAVAWASLAQPSPSHLRTHSRLSRGRAGSFHRLPPPQPHPGAAGRKSGKSCRDLAKCPEVEGRGPSGEPGGDPRGPSQTELRPGPLPSPRRRNGPVSGRGGSLRGPMWGRGLGPRAHPGDGLGCKTHRPAPGLRGPAEERTPSLLAGPGDAVLPGADEAPAPARPPPRAPELSNGPAPSSRPPTPGAPGEVRTSSPDHPSSPGRA